MAKQNYTKNMVAFVFYTRGRYGGIGVGGDHVSVIASVPRKNQSGEVPEQFPAWLGTTNGISDTVLRGYISIEAAEAGARYYRRKYGV